MYIRAYLRASTQDQDAQRARADLEAFARERGLRIAAWYAENESGASLKRPELFRLLADSHPGDVLLIEQVDRLSRLNAEDWDRLKAELLGRKVRVVALDLPTSHMMVKAEDEMTMRMMDALNSMMLDMLAAIARKDYEDRRRRTTQGIAQAKERDKLKPQAERAYKGRPANHERNTAILAMLDKGSSWSEVCSATGASRSTLQRLVKSRQNAET
ncbi:recombinase family protein [Pseudomonas sp. URIL14HWK12:I5]|uniref:recombinase family protein n=1 Tax=Pseudomonas sp. URIL14HWK12:I5 TaxID=1261630 RepID=UPI0009D8A1F2|nr:recombinase family protein [Pseudomonas sp. URIL14HWK12:I5]SMD13877.1 Site-specific DNA recombinase [Pseudomonas sp. URIL14HWK12:I5]